MHSTKKNSLKTMQYSWQTKHYSYICLHNIQIEHSK